MFQLLREPQGERTDAERSQWRALGEAAGLSRSTRYRYGRNGHSACVPGVEIELRDAIQHVALDWPCYGYRNVTAELRLRGFAVNHKRVLRLMHEDNLLCLRRRPFVKTTDSDHSLRVYPNLARGLVLTNINQLWVADITYIRLLSEFIYLAVLLDAFSRRCVGWALSASMTADLTLAALRMALRGREVPPGLVHHSDRGVQYAAGDYTDLLHENGILISMSRKGNPYDNAKAERFIRTLKYEEVYLSEYDNLAEARTSIGHFLEDVYNQKRLHSAIGYLPPAEFEHSLSLMAYP